MIQPLDRIYGCDDLRFSGLRIITDVNIVDRITVTERRTILERAWSWPWRPWVGTKDVRRNVPSSRVVATGTSLIMHPQTFAMLKECGAVPRDMR